MTDDVQSLRPRGASATFVGRCRRGLAWCAGRVGPGVVTGAADDDPSGIATYAIAGASLGYGLLWVALIATPMMMAVQETCARIGMVTGGGLVRAMERVMPRALLVPLVLLVVAANTLNIAADVAGMTSSAQLVTGIDPGVWAIAFGIGLVLVEVVGSYRLFASAVKWLCLSLLAYVVGAFFVHVDWLSALRHTVVPEVHSGKMWMATLVGFLGTTITPYLFVWQAALEVEEERASGRRTLAQRRGATTAEIRTARVDVAGGMLFSNVVSWFIVLTTATVLFPHHIAIASVSDAASALRPLAGPHAELLFALGVVGAGLLAVPVLAGSSAYALNDVFRWKGTLSARPRSAPLFYGVIVLGVVLGVVADFARFDAVTALFWSAIVNGFVAVPLLVGVFLAGNDGDAMGRWRNGRGTNVWLVLTIVAMGAAAIGMVLTT